MSFLNKCAINRSGKHIEVGLPTGHAHIFKNGIMGQVIPSYGGPCLAVIPTISIGKNRHKGRSGGVARGNHACTL